MSNLVSAKKSRVLLLNETKNLFLNVKFFLFPIWFSRSVITLSNKNFVSSDSLTKRGADARKVRGSAIKIVLKEES